MTDTATLEVIDRVGVITIDFPPVNALSAPVRAGLAEKLDASLQDAAIEAVVILCAGRTFFAGADISEFGKPTVQPDLLILIDQVEAMSKPVTAAIHGTALGGGLELALACNYRVAERSAKLGLPEVALGLIPGAGGTQRLPRIVGAQAALDLITSGRQMAAAEALALGVIDEVIESGALREGAIAFARARIKPGSPAPRVRDRTDRIEADRADPGMFDRFLQKNARAFHGFKAPEGAVRAIEASVTLPFEKGLEKERGIINALLETTESAAQRHLFFAERQTARVPDLASDAPALPVRSVAVIGAGTMGGGIAMNFANAGIPVRLLETTDAALQRGLGAIRKNYEATARKGRITSADVETRLGLLSPGIGLDGLGDVDLVIEAVFESMPLKKEVFAELDRVTKPEVVLASNTSFLDLDEIASATGRPERVVGLHFFSPANVMRLLEVVRGEKTSGEVVATAMKLAKQIGKTPVLSRVCDGFIANRAMRARSDQADALILEGASPAEIDAAMVGYGFAMGPFAMMDLVGLDVIGRGSTERTVMSELVATGRVGQKGQGGYYDYDETRKAKPSDAAQAIIQAIAAERKVARIDTPSENLLPRLLYPVVNEGAKILEEGIALRASDIDVALVQGYAWPVYTGGPMFWAGTVGLPEIVATLDRLAERHGEALRPADLLRRLAAEGKTFSDR